MSQVVLVTGASSGIGLACARAFAAAGYHVAAVARDEARLQALAQECKAAGQVVVPVIFDLTGAEPVESLVEQVRRAVGVPTVLVNAAGAIVSGPVDSVGLDAWDFLMNLNVRSVYALSRAILPSLREVGSGASIVNISSVAGLRPFPNLSAYCVSKAAIDQLTRSMAIELAPQGIRVNAVNPGVVVTELHRRSGMGDEAYDAFLKRGADTHPLGRVGTPEEVAALVLTLASAQSGWITGETIAIDGGRHLTALR